MPLDVLIVDDSAAIRKIVQRVLRQAELPLGQIYEAGDGLEALKTLGSQKVDLILADINMPNMDGLQLLENIKANEKWKHLPVVMVTTEGSESKVMSAAKLGAVGYVRKPFSAEQFRQTLDGIFAV
jgi:two-component system chemotaxis response regulator CheY